MSRQLLVAGGVVLAVLLFVGGRATYPRWGSIIRQSEHRQ